MSRKLIIFACLSTLCATLTSCAPGLGDSISVSRIPDSASQGLQDRASIDWDVRATVGQFADARAEKAVGEYNGKPLNAQSDVPASVQAALETALKARGVKLALFDSPTITGSITQWKVSVKQSFPTTEVESKAGLSLQIQSPEHRVVYNATYSGEAYEKNPFFSKDKIETVLGKAMEQAIAEALNDQNLLSQLTQYSQAK
jgi:uncharacterized lipoprotein YajG